MGLLSIDGGGGRGPGGGGGPGGGRDPGGRWLGGWWVVVVQGVSRGPGGGWVGSGTGGSG